MSESQRNSLDFYFGANKFKTLMLAQVNCSAGGFKYTFSNQEFRNKRNATFLVHVYEFAVPITIQISFSRRSPIQLLQFFMTFFGCLLALLVVAFAIWKGKQKLDQIRRRRQLVIQMEHMASRPFTKLLLDVTKAQGEEKERASGESGKPPRNPVHTLGSEESGSKKGSKHRFGCGGRLRGSKKLNKNSEYLEAAGIYF